MERERIKQFSIWFQETDTARQKEYVKRRKKRNQAESKRFSNIKAWKFLLVPAGLCLVCGTAMLFAANFNKINPYTIFETKKTLFNIIGGISVGFGVFLVLVVEGCIQHVNHRHDKENKIIAEADNVAERLLPQNFPVYIFRDDNIPDPYNDLQESLSRQNSKTSRGTSLSRQNSKNSEGTSLSRQNSKGSAHMNFSRQNSRGSSSGSQTKRAPKLGSLRSKSENSGQCNNFESVDSGTSVSSYKSYTRDDSNEKSLSYNVPLLKNSTQEKSELESMGTLSESLLNLGGATCADYSLPEDQVTMSNEHQFENRDSEFVYRDKY
ncbi:hypothetical protein FSP39_019876 [Pinctada imbricata]|uniref:Uncharacterized protein n=1 Tax=Pinctada imbricata TaxID=66713 RepID=A0AA88Y0G4_PINIB|nr:hypothetical protein FSP39_019876 [Pinctada imbricata]